MPVGDSSSVPISLRRRVSFRQVFEDDPGGCFVAGDVDSAVAAARSPRTRRSL